MVETRQGGSIVSVSSIGSLRVFDKASIYGASKAALDMVTKSMAFELGPHNIRVNSILPGLVLTPLSLTTTFGSDGGQQYIISRTPLRRIARMDDIVNATVFLLSDQSAMINGITMPVDGGFVI